MLIVTGATGRLGRAIVERLLEHVPAREIGISVRDPAKADDLARAGVRVRRGDFSDPASLADAFAGARRILIVSSNAAATGGDTLGQHRAAIAAAKEAGAHRILYTSHAAASPGSAFPPCRNHAATEAILAECGVRWTALRHGFYADSIPTFLGDWRTTGVIAAPADGPVAWTARADLAQADARLLARETADDGPTPPLTGPEALDLAAVGALAGAVAGVAVRREILPDAAFEARFAAGGAPASAAATVLGFFKAARDGEFAAVDSTLSGLLGRPPRTVRDGLASAAG